MELYYYALMSLGISATFDRAKLFLKISIVLLLILFALMVLQDARIVKWVGLGRPYLNLYYFTIFYKSFLGVTIFFALGALAYHVKLAQWQLRSKILTCVIVLPLPLIGLGGTYGFLIAMLAFGCGIALLLSIWPNNKPGPVGQFLGDMSYPLFLIHWPVGVFISAWTGLSKDTPEYFVLAAAASLTAAALIVLVVERPLESLRDRVRGRKIAWS